MAILASTLALAFGCAGVFDGFDGSTRSDGGSDIWHVCAIGGTGRGSDAQAKGGVACCLDSVAAIDDASATEAGGLDSCAANAREPTAENWDCMSPQAGCASNPGGLSSVTGTADAGQADRLRGRRDAASGL